MSFRVLIFLSLIFPLTSIAQIYETLIKDHRPTLLERSSSEIVISKKSIEKLNPTSVVDILEKAGGMSGLSVQGATKSVFLRGAGADQVLFILDGVVLNDPTSPSGAFDLTFLDVQVIEEIRIWTATESVLWGSGGLGGIISIRTRNQGGSLQIVGGSDQSFLGSGAIFVEPDPITSWTRGFLVSSRQSAGQSVAASHVGGLEKDQMQMSTVMGKAQRNYANSLVQILALTNQSFEDLDGVGSSGPIDDPNSRRNQRQNLFSVRYDFNPLPNWEVHQDYSLKSMERNHFDPANISGGSATTGLYISNGTAYRLQNLIGQSWGYWDFGFDLSQNQSHIEEDSGSTSKTLIGKTENVGGLYLRAVWGLENWKIFPGLRLEKQNSTDQLSSIRVEYQLSPFRIFDFEVTQGVKRPTLYQKYYPGGGNEELQSEKVEHRNLGHTFYSGRDQEKSFRVFLFSSRWKNLITYDLSSSKYLNISQAQSDGYEISALLNCHHSVAGLRFTEMWTKDSQGQALLRRPRYLTVIDYSQDQASMSYAVIGQWKSGREDSVGGSRYPLASQWKWDLTTVYKFKNQLDLHFDVKNVFDSREEEIYGYSAPERTVYLGFSIAN